jgi:ABC-2 type transport system ATP-binding protein
MLQIQNLKKAYSGHTIVRVPTLTLAHGIHWFKGANGSGKTTFFRVLSGMLPFEGNITLDGFDIRKNAVDYRLRINYGEAEPAYPDFVTAHDLIQFVKITKKATNQQVTSLIEKLNIGSFIHQPVATYSSGMLKKTSLLLAFLGSPKVIILDEPLITIDDATVNLMYDLILDYYQNRGVLFMLSSHQDFRFDRLPIHSTYTVSPLQSTMNSNVLRD